MHSSMRIRDILSAWSPDITKAGKLLFSSFILWDDFDFAPGLRFLAVGLYVSCTVLSTNRVHCHLCLSLCFSEHQTIPLNISLCNFLCAYCVVLFSFVLLQYFLFTERQKLSSITLVTTYNLSMEGFGMAPFIKDCILEMCMLYVLVIWGWVNFQY